MNVTAFGYRQTEVLNYVEKIELISLKLFLIILKSKHSYTKHRHKSILWDDAVAHFVGFSTKPSNA